LKTARIRQNSKLGQRLRSIDVTKDWDAVLVVLLDENFDAAEMHVAERAAVLAALSASGSKARNERGQLGVSKFKAIGNLRWRGSATKEEDLHVHRPGIARCRRREKQPQGMPHIGGPSAGIFE
jgi:hypothetical protein